MKKTSLIAAVLAVLMLSACAVSTFTVFAADKVIPGDTNLDGKVNIKDATLIQKVAALLVSQPDHYMETSDVDLNGSVNVKDATVIQRFLADYYKSLPIKEQPTETATETATETTTETTEPATQKPTEKPTQAPTTVTEPTTTATPTKDDGWGHQIYQP
ncbi:MAG: dockerin type I repeat-containing protein [Ruminococcus sp.]|nr:dockerin type I repeat-containing protein [Ruminococcus sp.]